MPLYEYKCSLCGEQQEVRSTVELRNEWVWCPCDWGHGERVMTAPHLHGSPNMPNG